MKKSSIAPRHRKSRGPSGTFFNPLDTPFLQPMRPRSVAHKLIERADRQHALVVGALARSADKSLQRRKPR